MYLKKTILPLLSFGLFIGSANAADTAEYFPLINKVAGDNACLAVSSDRTSLYFESCTSPRGNAKWKFSGQGGGNYFIHNDSDPEKCLRTMGNGTTVTLGTCKGDGYTSMRVWTIKHNLDGTLTFNNKYNNDLGRRQSLNAQMTKNTVQMSNENPEKLSHWNYDGSIPAPVRPVVGNKKVLVMATHFNGAKPADPELIRKAVFGETSDDLSLRNYLKQASHGKLNLEGTLLENINLGDRPATCDTNGMLKNAREAARQQGIEPDDYDYLFVDISRTSACKFEGRAAMPGNWILSNAVGYKVWMWSHEFGHNLGFNHSNTLINCPVENGIPQLGSRCKTGGGGDLTDTMGGGGSKVYPVDYQLFAGWLDDSEVPMVKRADLYALRVLWKDGQAQGYRIQRRDGSVLVLEYRKPQPGFESWPEDSPYVNGLIVRVLNYKGNSIVNSLVDTTPGSPLGTKDAPLMPGESLYDELSDTRITFYSGNQDWAVFGIDHGK